MSGADRSPERGQTEIREACISNLRALLERNHSGNAECCSTARLYAQTIGDLEAAGAALELAVRTIRTWHGMGMGPAEAQAWELYQASPEMQQINSALGRLVRS